LRKADDAKQAGDGLAEFETHNALGMFYEEAGLLPYTACQYQKCLSIANSLEFADGQMAAHLALGTGAHFFLIH
jgi:hypothetical protein